jgi:protein-tyrosine phosphatase
MSSKVKVLFVCMGNLCRSPMAEGVFRQHVVQAGLERHIEIDSAGTHDYHVGDPPDARAQRAAGRRGYDLSALRGRQVDRDDFSEFDYVLAMDVVNLRSLERVCPPQHTYKIRLFMDFSAGAVMREVPDPYYGGEQGFELVLDMVEEASRGLLEHLRRRLDPRLY